MEATILQRELPKLTQDAALLRCELQAEAQELRLELDCLRRDSLGRRRPVLLVLERVQLAVLAIDGRDPAQPPSDVRAPRQLEHEPLRALTATRKQASVTTVGSRQAVEDVWLSAITVPLMRPGQDASIELVVTLEDQPTRTCWRLLVAAETLSARELDGTTLPVSRWRGEYAAWWQPVNAPPDIYAGDHDDGDHTVTAVSPAVMRLQTLTTEPLREPTVELAPHSLGPALVSALTRWFEALRQRDPDELEAAQPHLDAGHDPNATFALEWLDSDVMRTGYAREIVSHWVDGRRAGVVVRGAEHTTSLDGTAQECALTEWRMGFVQRGQRWFVRRVQSRSLRGEPLPPSAGAWLARWTANPRPT